MDKPRETTGNYETALSAAELGYVCIPCLPRSKVPAIRWKPFQDSAPTKADYRAWFEHTRNNIALICGGLIVVDVDDMNEVDFVIENCGKTQPMTKTPRGGIHLPYRARKGVHVPNHVEVKGRKIDLRSRGGLVVIPNSVTEKGAYEWLGLGLRPIDEYPVFRVTWARERTKKRLQAVVFDENVEAMVRRARAYIATIEPAVSGQGGHNRTFRVACTLVQKFGLTDEQAWPILLEYGERCLPPWTEGELRHKLEDAVKVKR